MAFQGKIISSSLTGNIIKFLRTSKDTNGKLLEMEARYISHSKEPSPHYHPYQFEDFTVLSGQLTVRIYGQLNVLRTGDALHVPRNTVHSMWNHTDDETIINWKVQPAMETEYLLETLTGLATDGKTSKNGVPSILQVALLGNKYSNIFRLARPTYVVQKILFTLLTPISYLFGNKPTYKKYID